MAIIKLVSFFWGFAEATFFFIIPDVFLAWLVLTQKEYKKIRAAVSWAVFGAICGGVLMYWLGYFIRPEILIGMLDHIPGISQAIISDVSAQIEKGGISSVFLGIIKGIPYKLYASQWGYYKGNIWILIACSVFARGGRFILSVLVTFFIDSMAKKLFINWEHVKRPVFTVFWITFYIFYFIQYPL
ncbi:MAG: hypothetical protein HQL27_01070 [Candidatus Omnitrophica bacterium]|nr:hypothetical protein [Candidatus Omnitrophota bacterium]